MLRISPFSLLIFCGALISSPGFSVHVDKCPEKFSISLSDFQFIEYVHLTENDYWDGVEPWSVREQSETYHYLKGQTSISWQFALLEKKNSKCYYESMENIGKESHSAKSFARIDGTNREPSLTVTYQDYLKFSLYLNSYDKDGLSITPNTRATIVSHEEFPTWDDPIYRWLTIGYIESSGISLGSGDECNEMRAAWEAAVLAYADVYDSGYASELTIQKSELNSSSDLLFSFNVIVDAQQTEVGPAEIWYDVQIDRKTCSLSVNDLGFPVGPTILFIL